MTREPTDEEVTEIYKAAGEITLRWGRMELSLNIIIGGIYLFAGGRHVHDELPLMMSRRLRFLRQCFLRIEALSSFKDEAMDLIDLVSDAAKLRELLAHGGLIGVTDETDGLALHFNMLRPHKSRLHYRLVEEKASLLRLTESANLVSDVSAAVTNFGDRLGKTLMREEPTA